MNIFTSALQSVKPRLDDLGTDRLSYYYSTIMIMVISITITAKQYVGSPLQCWVPAQFTRAWEQYAENYCFVYNTYWVKIDGEVPSTVDQRVAQQLIYYQWVPFIMALEALFFYLPVALWGQMNRTSGMNIEQVVKTAQAAESGEEAVREKNVHVVCTHLDDYIKLQKTRANGATFITHVTKFGQLDGTYICNVYMVTKVLFLINLIGQFLMMNQFLGQNNHLWGASILSDIISGSNWEDTGNFPRIAMCDFQVRVLGNLQRYSIQCVLVLNMFNEKIFLFLYWWFIAIYIITFQDTIQMAMNSRTQKKKIEFVKTYIKNKPDEDMYLEQFINARISADIMIVLKMITAHSSEIITTEILEVMWKQHKNETFHNGKDDREKMPLMDLPMHPSQA